MRKSNRQKTFWSAAVCVLMIAAASATDYYVDGGKGSNSKSGKSWAEARQTIQSAYALASDGDVIHVADGVYEKINVNGEKRVTIRSQNGPGVTTINGGGTTRCASFYYSDWSTPFIDTVVDGFTLTGGYREGSGGAAYGGTYRNCRIVGNVCTKSGGAGYRANMYDCTIVSNVAGNCAGAIYEGNVGSCMVLHNVATNFGGAFYDCDGSNCVIVGNCCGRSGGAAYGGAFRECTIIGNRCGAGGGAGYESEMFRCTICSNVAGNCAGAVYGGWAESCMVLENVATNWGGAFYGCQVRNSVIAGNYCGKTGGGAYEGRLIGCTVFANLADTGTAGAYNVAATNTILWANQNVGGKTSNWSKGTFGHCVLYPNVEGEMNTDRDPLLYCVEKFDGRLCENSSCIDAGENSVVCEALDVIGNPRIANNTVDIGAYEGVVNGTSGRVGANDKPLIVAPGEESAFTLDDGGEAVIFGVAPLLKSDFVAQGSSGELRYDNRNLIDAEKSASVANDDYWCQQMTEVNLTVWGGWSDYVGFTNEDDFAEYLRENDAITGGKGVLRWVFDHVPNEYAYGDYVKWTWFRDYDTVIGDFIARTADKKCWTYLQMDWVDAGSTNIIGSHAVTCCGYALDPSYAAGTPQSLQGLFVINSDNDKGTGNGGRFAPNSISYYPVRWDAGHKKFMLKWSAERDGMLEFLCYLYGRPYAAYGEATVRSPGGAIPYSWLVGHGLYSPGRGVSAETAASQYWRHYVAGTDPNDPAASFRATINISNGQVYVGWTPDLGSERKYTVYGRTSLTDDSRWHAPPEDADCFFSVNVDLHNPMTTGGYGIIPESVIAATNRYAVYKGKLSLIDANIVDAEKIDGVGVDDLGCGEATGANLSWMLGWAQKAGFESEDDVFRQFYLKYGDLGKTGGVWDVLRFVIEKIPGESPDRYIEQYEGFTLETFKKIESGITSGKGCGIYFLHGTPHASDGNHVVTLWGVCKDENYLPTDPRYYAGVIISDSDDDKTGYGTAEEAPNRVKFMSVTWDEDEHVYCISDGYLVRAYIISPPGL